jgi:hypothetical protein
MDEHVIAAIVPDYEAKALLRVEEFDDAFAFANNLRGHSAAAATKAATATAAAETTAATETSAVAISAAAAAEAAAITESAASAAVAATLLEPQISAERIFFAETIALVAAATTAIPLAPSIETHAVKTSVCPQ